MLGVYNDAGELVEIGQVSTIGKGDVNAGDVIEVRFMGVTDPTAPRLYQPRIMRKRTDKSAAECSDTQLAHAWMNKTIDIADPEATPAATVNIVDPDTISDDDLS